MYRPTAFEGVHNEITIKPEIFRALYAHIIIGMDASLNKRISRHELFTRRWLYVFL